MSNLDNDKGELEKQMGKPLYDKSRKLTDSEQAYCDELFNIRTLGLVHTQAIMMAVWVEAHTQSKLKAFAGEVSDKVLAFGSWQEGKCYLHENYTSACCGCQKEKHALKMLEDYQTYIEKALKAIKESWNI